MAEFLEGPPAKSPICGCLGQLRVALRDDNGLPGVDHRTGSALLFVRRLDKDGRVPPMVAASFCPLCGEAYQ